MTQLLNFSASLHHQFDHKKILILGWGREGQSTFQTLGQCCPAAQLFVSDQDQSSIQQWLAENHSKLEIAPYLQDLDTFDVIFKTPGIPVRLPALQSYLSQGKQLTSQLNEFLRIFRDQVTGVTGTKGKSTTSSLMRHLLQTVGKEVVLAGNIGLPVFEIASAITPQTEVVIEMSSYQLETVEVSPHRAILLNFFPEHLNYHQSLANYLAAKAQITLFQTADDFLIFNQDSTEIQSIAKNSVAQKIPFSYQQNLLYSPLVTEVLSRQEELKLPAVVTKRNLLPALLATEQVQHSATEVIQHLATFQTLAHRLEVVGQYQGITWIDDTLATIPEATIVALETLPRVDVILLGGYDRGISFEKIVEACLKKKVPAIGFFKPSGQIMYDLLHAQYPRHQWPIMKVVEDMKDAVAFGYAAAPAGGTVLLSPSSPSFGQFKDYQDKSAQFRDWILRLA